MIMIGVVVMAIRQIRKDGDPELRKKAVAVTRFAYPLHRIIEDMIDTMNEAEGVGLAAPQIGITKRVIVIRDNDTIFEIVNPEIIASQGEATDIEGCLSCPGVYGEVPRAVEVEVKGKDRDGNDMVIAGQNLLARVLQHEIDHLDGVLFLDKVIRLLDPEDINKISEKNR